MNETPVEAGGLRVVAAEPVPGIARPTVLFRGSWCQDGGMVAKQADFALLQSRAGMTVYLDRRAIELAALALGLTVVDPAAAVRKVCSWGGGVMAEGPPGSQELTSHGICPCCRKRETETRRAGRTAEIGR